MLSKGIYGVKDYQIMEVCIWYALKKYTVLRQRVRQKYKFKISYVITHYWSQPGKLSMIQ